MTINELYVEMRACQACPLRQGCIQVVPGIGQTYSPILMIVGEAPGQQEDEDGVPFVGQAGMCLREILREVKVINPTNTLITNTVKCRPPANKFPKDESPSICVSMWLNKEIDIAKPKLMMLLGNVPLKYVAGMSGITSCRGKWFDVKGIKTMATFHPSYVIRSDRGGDMLPRRVFREDIFLVAEEVRRIQSGNSTPSPVEL